MGVYASLLCDLCFRGRCERLWCSPRRNSRLTDSGGSSSFRVNRFSSSRRDCQLVQGCLHQLGGGTLPASLVSDPSPR